MTTSDWQGRIANWKFVQAERAMPNTHPDREIVKCLARLYGDSGWFGGVIGEFIETIVQRLLRP